MADPTSPIGKAQASDEVVCYGTAFVAENPAESLDLLLQAPALSRPQLASPGLDDSFLTTCLRLLGGDVDGDGLRRLGGSRGRASTAVLLFACSQELRDLLSTVNERRAKELATRWSNLIDTTVTTDGGATARIRRGRPVVSPSRISPRAEGRARHRITLLLELARLASLARAASHTLVLRVEYHRRRTR